MSSTVTAGMRPSYTGNCIVNHRCHCTAAYLPAGARAVDELASPAIPGRRLRNQMHHPRMLLGTLVTVFVLTLAACSAQASPATQASAAPSATASPAASTSASPAPAAPPVGTGTAAQLQEDFVAVVQQVAPSVVVIQTDQGLGSGVIFDNQGHVVTNAHVTAGASQFQVTLADGRQQSATLVGSFASDDLAVLKMSDPTNLRPATFADSSQLQVGDIVMAIGNPLGLQSSVTEGIVSALNRTVSEPGGVALPGVIQTSAAINPGNSGGALVDLAGQVVGIPTLAATDPQIGGSAPGIGFAIPSSTASDIARQLISTGHVVSSGRAYLGIQSADTFGGQGVYVVRVATGGPAAAAGITNGELIISIDGKATPDNQTLSELLAQHKPGDKVTVALVKPNGSQVTVTVTLGEVTS
jgi:putative serine protease PepD